MASWITSILELSSSIQLINAVIACIITTSVGSNSAAIVDGLEVSHLHRLSWQELYHGLVGARWEQNLVGNTASDMLSPDPNRVWGIVDSGDANVLVLAGTTLSPDAIVLRSMEVSIVDTILWAVGEHEPALLDESTIEGERCCSGSTKQTRSCRREGSERQVVTDHFSEI